MTLTRRVAIKQLVIAAAGAALLPACFHDRRRSMTTLKNITLYEDQENRLEELTAVLIPTTSTPGAKDISAHLFVLKMLDDCYPKADQEKFLRGLDQLDTAARVSGGAPFLQLTPEQKNKLVAALDKDPDFFYSTTKKLTIQAYTTSSYFLTKVQVYELVPGRFHGCVPVKKAS